MNAHIMTQIAIAAVLATACTASADQFAIQTTGPFAGASPKLLQSLHVRELDAVEINGEHFIVLDAKDEGYVEAYIYATNIPAEALYHLETDWTGRGLSSLPMEKRKDFFLMTFCEFCTG